MEMFSAPFVVRWSSLFGDQEIGTVLRVSLEEAKRGLQLEKDAAGFVGRYLDFVLEGPTLRCHVSGRKGNSLRTWQQTPNAGFWCWGP